MIQAGRKQNRKAQVAQAQPVPFAAPVGGWVENANITQGEQGYARVMENIFPGLQGCRIRGGAQQVATVGARVKALFGYQSGSTTKLFASTAAAIYDVSALDPDTVPTASVSGMGSGYWSVVQMGTAGGEFLVCVNGTDTPRTYNGSTWATTSITGVTSTELSFVTKHKSRLWFVRKNTLVAWYLPVDSIAGAAADFSLAGVMQRGGSLLFIATWSQDSGDGQDDRIVFVSTEGECAVYQGTNPASAADWSLVGVYNITKPLGSKAHMRAGGDLVIATEAGIVPLSAVTTKDPASMDVAAVTRAIEPSWRNQVKRRTATQPVELIKWPRENMLMVSLPHDISTSFVANLQTGAWCKYIGWDVQAAALFNDQMYFGDRAGSIFAAETGGNDNDAAYVCRLSYMPSDLGGGATTKAASMMRARFLSFGPVTAQLSIAPNYDVIFPALPPETSVPANPGSYWGVSLWGQALWGGEVTATRPTYNTGWTAVGANGEAIAPQLQMVVRGPGRPSAELIAIDVLTEAGGI